MAENHDIGARRQSVILSQEPSDENVLFLKKQSVIFEEPSSGGFSRAIWLEYANQ